VYSWSIPGSDSSILVIDDSIIIIIIVWWNSFLISHKLPVNPNNTSPPKRWICTIRSLLYQLTNLRWEKTKYLHSTFIAHCANCLQNLCPCMCWLCSFEFAANFNNIHFKIRHSIFFWYAAFISHPFIQWSYWPENSGYFVSDLNFEYIHSSHFFKVNITGNM
jgi:hypothetical protein